jgi:PAS domain S-box-containing protein
VVTAQVNSTPLAGAVQDAAAHVLDAVPEAYACFDSQFRYTFLNRAREQLLAEDRANLLGQILWEVHPALVGTRFQENCRRAMAERVPVMFEDYDQALQRWFAFTATPDSEGGIVLRTVDIAGRQQPKVAPAGKVASFDQRAEERTGKPPTRQRSVSRLQHSLLDAAPLENKLQTVADAIIRLFDADFCRIWLIRPGDLCERGCIHAGVRDGPHVCRRRDRCLHLLASAGRYTRIDGPGHRRVPFGCYKIGRLASEEEAKFLSNDVQHDPRILDHAWARELGLVSFAGYQLRTPGEETLGVLALFSKHPILADEDALLDGLGSTVALMVKRAAAEESLVRRTEELARSNYSLSESQRIAHVGSWSMEVPIGTGVCAWTPETYRLFGVSPDTFVPSAELFQRLIHPDDRAAMQAWIGACLAGEEPPDLEFRVGLPDGGVRYILGRGHLVRDAGNQPIRMVGIAQDITERKRAEEKLRLALADLGRSNKDLEQFAYVASHDLQEPLRMVSSYTQLLARRYQGQLDASANKFIAYAVDGANRMQRLIEDLLAYSRVGARAKGFERIDCTAALDRALANLKAAIDASGAVVTHGPLPAVVHDNLLLVQLFQNLIGNAIKFHVEAPPRVHVTAEQKAEEWVFAVRDNGIGIDPQYAQRIFTIFQRLHTNEEYSGTGIGLAICKKIVERRGGRIWVESQPGSGSTFYFTVPIGGAGL